MSFSNWTEAVKNAPDRYKVETTMERFQVTVDGKRHWREDVVERAIMDESGNDLFRERVNHGLRPIK